jgi:hypothetical protein
MVSRQARQTEKSVEISETMAALWTRYAGVAPSSAKTVLRDDTVTISIAGVVEDLAPLSTKRRYEKEATATIGRLTRRRVLSMKAGHNCESDVETDVFQLAASGRRARLRKPARAGSR